MEDEHIDLPTGPAVDIEDMQLLAGFCRQSGWAAFERHIKRVWQSAENRSMKFNGPQQDGYWKGIKALCLDLLSLPKNLGKQIEAVSEMEKGGKKDEE
jgi:hypothetical protein